VVRQHIRPEPSLEQAGENVGGIHRKLPHIFSTKSFLYEINGSAQATKAGLPRVIQGLYDRHADADEAARPT